MTPSLPATGLELRSLLHADGTLEVSLVDVPLPEPADDEVLLRVEATPMNPSDLGLLFGPADLAAARHGGSASHPLLQAPVPAAALAGLGGRIGRALPVGNEGAGTVVRAGRSAAAQALLGRIVAAIPGGMYCQYRCVKAAQCLPLPPGRDAVAGASCFVNPLTALGMVETMRQQGHTALVHTVGASNLGQMLQRICSEDGIGLVNIVRRPEQAALLRAQGARHVCDSSAPDFQDQLTQALQETGATLVFDAIGGGRLAGQILQCMEGVIVRRAGGEYSRYGSNVHKQVYVYGSLDRSPIELPRNIGMAWGVGGWLLFPFLERIGAARADALRQRVLDGLGTTFASHYTRVVSLAGALRPDAIAEYRRLATGAKFLIDPQRAD